MAETSTCVTLNLTLCLSVCQTADKLIRTFAEQIFYTGFIHADPHAGNGGSTTRIFHYSHQSSLFIP